jgi:hypothetical protein
MHSGIIRIVSLCVLVAALFVCFGTAESDAFGLNTTIIDTCCPVEPQEEGDVPGHLPAPCSDAACACPSCLVADEPTKHIPSIPYAEGSCGAAAVRSLPPSPVAPPIEYPPETV